MEEKNITNVENTEVNNTANSNTEGRKLSYEELEQVAHQLSEQARNLYNQLQKVNYSNTFKRLDYLFKVIENPGIFHEDFYDCCIKEIEERMELREVSDEPEMTETPNSEE